MGLRPCLHRLLPALGGGPGKPVSGTTLLGRRVNLTCTADTASPLRQSIAFAFLVAVSGRFFGNQGNDRLLRFLLLFGCFSATWIFQQLPSRWELVGVE